MPTAAEWKTASQSSNDNIKDRVYQISLVYQIKRNTHEPAERIRLLADLRALCAAHRASHGLASPGYAAFVQLGMQTDKELQLIQTAQGAWDKARQVFAPAMRRAASFTRIRTWSASFTIRLFSAAAACWAPGNGW